MARGVATAAEEMAEGLVEAAKAEGWEAAVREAARAAVRVAEEMEEETVVVETAGAKAGEV